MAFRRRKFKRRQQWFPPLGASFSIGDNVFDVGFDTIRVDVLASGAQNAVELPVTFDFGQEEIQDFATPNVPAITLADLQGSGWQCRRVVGRIHAAYSPLTNNDQVVTGADTSPPGCIFAAGLMVRRVSGQASNTGGNVALFSQDDYTDPWIWRRTWVLGQNAQYTVSGLALNASAVGAGFSQRYIGARGFTEQEVFALFPPTTAHYGSVSDGPVLDQKTNRIIGGDERLFLHFATKALPIQPQTNFTTDGHVIGVFDLRMLGGLRKFTNRRNASR